MYIKKSRLISVKIVENGFSAFSEFILCHYIDITDDYL